MSAGRIQNDQVRWTVDQQQATEREALAALRDRPLLVLMHGFGSFEGDLIELAPRLPERIVCASPRAPFVAPPPIVNGFAWWPLRLSADGTVHREPPPESFVGSAPHAAAELVLSWLDELDARLRAGEVGEVDEPGEAPGLGAVAVLGFSQGGCLVTSLLRLRPERFRCGVTCSGFLAPGAFPGDTDLAASAPPMFWGYDPEDPIIGRERIAELAVWAPAHTALVAHSYPGIGHSISAAELADIDAFLAAHLLGAPPHVPEGSA